MRPLATALALALTVNVAAALGAAAAPDGVAALRAAAQAKGKVRVVARLRTTSADARTAAAPEAALRGRLAGVGVRRVDRLDDLPLVVLELDPRQLDSLLQSGLAADVAEDELLRPDFQPDVQLVAAPEAWSAGASGQGQVVAVLDTGVDRTHPYLKGKVVSEACYSTTSASQNATSLCPGNASSALGPGSAGPCPATMKDCEHGTHVAGIVAGRAQAYSGIAPLAHLVSIQVYSAVRAPSSCYSPDPCPLAFGSDIIRGLNRVRALGKTYRVAAANLSLGGGLYRRACDGKPVKLAIDALRAQGTATVVASGNGSSSEGVSFPGCVSTAVTVSSSGGQPRNEWISSFANFSPLVDLVAPGESIVSSIPGGGYKALSGTSMAAPHVAGAWAVLRSKSPDATVDQIERVLVSAGTMVHDIYANNLAKPRIELDKALLALRRATAGS